MALIRAGERLLTTATQVFDALDGNAGVIEATGAAPQQVSNWRTRGKFPPERFLQLAVALHARRLAAAPTLFGMHKPIGGKSCNSRLTIACA